MFLRLLVLVKDERHEVQVGNGDVILQQVIYLSVGELRKLIEVLVALIEYMEQSQTVTLLQ